MNELDNGLVPWALRAAAKIGPEGCADQWEAASFALYCFQVGSVAARLAFESGGTPGLAGLARDVSAAREELWGKRF